MQASCVRSEISAIKQYRFIISVLHIGWVKNIAQLCIYFLNFKLTFSVILAITSNPYIVGFAYYELGYRNVTIYMPVTNPNNTGLIVTLYKPYRSHQSSFGQQDAAINIAGPGRKNIKIIVGATYIDVIYFPSNLVNMQVPFAGFDTAAVHKVAQSEFSKRANGLYS